MSNSADTEASPIISWDENQQPLSTLFGDVYFSKENGLEETRFVFLEHNHLRERWQQLENNSRFFIAETGFGTGLNFLASWQLWQQCVTAKQAHLHFYSVEKYPLNKHDLSKALSLWPELATLATQLLHAWPPHFVEGVHKLEFRGITLTLFFGDVIAGLDHLLPAANSSPEVKKQNAVWGWQRPLIDAWFLDGFAPAKNPQMWQTPVFQRMAALSKPGTSFATFTSAGIVKRGLQEAGFACNKTKGFGNKREMLFGFFQETKELPEQANDQSIQHTSTHSKAQSSWHLVEQQTYVKPAETAIVVGGGLAGCHAAYALAQRGIQVTILERHDTLASEASANRRAVLYTRLSPETGPLNIFNLNALLYACRFYANTGLFENAGSQCGVLHLATGEKEQLYFRELTALFSASPELFQYCSPEQASALAGIKLEHDGVFVPGAGWLNPSAVCKELSAHSNIRIRFQAEVKNFIYEHTTWKVHTSSEIFSADAVILANARDVQTFAESAHLPLKSIRGQVTYLPELPADLPQPVTVICGDGYMTPYSEHGLCMGASFNLHSKAKEISEQDQRDNLQRFRNACPEYSHELESMHLANLEALVGFRCTTPDYFPIVGPMPDAANFANRFQHLRKNSKACQDICGVFHPNLYCLTGLGSRGLAYAPLIADALASSISGEALPFSHSLWLHLHPARFLIRNLIRNRPLSGLN